MDIFWYRLNLCEIFLITEVLKVVFLTRRFWDIEKPFFWPSGVLAGSGCTQYQYYVIGIFFLFEKFQKKKLGVPSGGFPSPCRILKHVKYVDDIVFRSQHSRFFDCFLEIQCPSDTKEPAILHSYPFQYKESEANKLKPVPNFAFPCQLQM